MKNLTTALFTKFTGSAFSTSIGGRLSKGRAPQGVVWPYAIYFVVSDDPADTFKDAIEETLVQFSLFSKESSTTEILNAQANLQALFDNAVLAITGSTLVMIRRVHGDGDPRSIFDDTEGGEGLYWQLDTQYEIIVQKN